MGEAHLEKARGFEEEYNWAQSFRFSESALKRLKKLNPRSLEVIIIIDCAMASKYNALSYMDQNKDALECAKERYSLWAAGNMRHHGMLNAAFPLIDGLMRNEEYEQAELIARTAYEMIINDTDNIIPKDDRRQHFLADGSRVLATTTFRLAESGGIAPDKKQKAGERAITLARKALEIRTQLHGTDSALVANDMNTLANILSYFKGVDDDEILHLQEQAIAISSRVQGRLSLNVAVNEFNLGNTYQRRAMKAQGANDLNRCVTNLELALTRYREAERIYRAIHRIDAANETAKAVEGICKKRQQIFIERAAATRG